MCTAINCKKARSCQNGGPTSNKRNNKITSKNKTITTVTNNKHSRALTLPKTNHQHANPRVDKYKYLFLQRREETFVMCSRQHPTIECRTKLARSACGGKCSGVQRKRRVACQCRYLILAREFKFALCEFQFGRS